MKYLFGICLLLMVSCKATLNDKNITGEWKASNFESHVEGISPQMVEAGKKEFLSSVYDLKDKHYLLLTSTYYKNGAEGSWSLDPVKKEITFKYAYLGTNGNEKYTITSFSKNRMTLEQTFENMKGTVQLTLVRNN